MKSIILSALIALIGLPQPQQSPDLSTVLQRAGEYVAQYEQQLGNLIGTEEYTQNWIQKNQRQRLLSDFLIIKAGPNRFAVRRVNRVDGKKVKASLPSFDRAFDRSPKENPKRLEELYNAGTKYHLGDIKREMNLPTFVLKVLRESEAPRFVFNHTGTATVAGAETWVIRFSEQIAPALLYGGNHVPLFINGTVWVEPATGRVLKTEYSVESTAAHAKQTITVTFAEGKNVKMLLPSVMDEHYESESSTIDCQAVFSNFRPFKDVKFED